MKKLAFVAAMLAVYAFAETNSIDWRYGKPGVVVITNAPSVARFTGEIARVEGRIDGINLSASDHAALSNLSWTAGGHYGTPARLAGFFEGGMAGYAGFGWGMYLDGDDNIAVSNEIISGAALGATAIQPSVFIPLADRVSGLEGRSNDWNTAFGWGSHAGLYLGTDSWAQWLSTNTYVKVETDAIALDALATNKVTRWYDPELSTRWAEWDGGTNIVIYKAEVSGTAITVSGGFNPSVNGVYTNAATESGFHYIGPSPYVIKDDIGVVAIYDTQSLSVAAWSDNTAAPYGPWNNGVEIIDITSVFSAYVTNTVVEWRYFLPTNAIPKELSNLDALQGWLNNLYAGKAAFDGHVTDGTHTNVTLIGPVTLTNSTSFAAGSYFGTNGVFFTRDGTNNWILF